MKRDWRAAVEDAATPATALTADREDVEAAFAEYEATRQVRAARIQQTSRQR